MNNCREHPLHKGYVHSQETKERIRLKKLGCKGPNLGRKFPSPSPEILSKMRESQKLRRKREAECR
jgi:hypothetical protein